MIDARGLLCPMPVVLVQKEVKANHPDVLEVLADDPYAKENIKRFANNNGYEIQIEENGEELKLTLRKK